MQYRKELGMEEPRPPGGKANMPRPSAIAYGSFGPSDAVGGSVFGTCGRVWAAATPSFDANSAVEDQMRYPWAGRGTSPRCLALLGQVHSPLSWFPVRQRSVACIARSRPPWTN